MALIWKQKILLDEIAANKLCYKPIPYTAQVQTFKEEKTFDK